MRHINGVYTQRYNRLKKTDGSLFRGRYKAILVESDRYQLQLSRYIHRNPLEAGVVPDLEDYEWSSYLYYINKKSPPNWLNRGEVLGQLSAKADSYEKYRVFVGQGVDDEIEQFYSKGNVKSYLGGDEFRDWVYAQRTTADVDVTEVEKSHFRPEIALLIRNVATEFGVSEESILTGVRGQENVPRWVAMYVCQEKGGHRLMGIARKFGLKRSGGVSSVVGKLRKAMLSDQELREKVNRVI